MFHDPDARSWLYQGPGQTFVNPMVRWQVATHRDPFWPGFDRPFPPWRALVALFEPVGTAGPHPVDWQRDMRLLAAADPQAYGVLYADRLVEFASAKAAALLAKNEPLAATFERRLVAAIDTPLCPDPFPWPVPVPPPGGGPGVDPDHPHPIGPLLARLMQVLAGTTEGSPLHRAVQDLIGRVGDVRRRRG